MMSYCIDCGTKLIPKELEHEGIIPYCENCEAFRFLQYNVAMSAIVYDDSEEHILLIQQYGMKQNILVAGYVGRGEALEEAVSREVAEETGLEVTDICFNASRFYEKNNVLMLNVACCVKEAAALNCNYEIGKATWFTPEEARAAIYSNSLAQEFLVTWLEKKISVVR